MHFHVQGKINSLQQPVLDFFPGRQVANLDERKRGMTLEHLLMLAPGLECDDAKGTEALMTQSQDWVQFVLDLPMAAAPGEKWAYCSSAVHLVSAILQEATGMDARTYANQVLFKQIGIAEMPRERWPSDPSGVSTGGSGLMLTPAELARLAYLYLNQGRWGDRQVVPEKWVADSTSPHIAVGKLKAMGIWSAATATCGRFTRSTGPTQRSVAMASTCTSSQMRIWLLFLPRPLPCSAMRTSSSC